MTKQILYPSPAGDLILAANNDYISHIVWKSASAKLPSAAIVSGKPPVLLQETIKQLDEYFAGKRQSFNLPIKQSGTDFQQCVWQALQDIPYGETISYKQLAAYINNAKAVRAVGSANGKNSLSIVVPCHRVIAADGSIGGYAGGLSSKQILLLLEKNQQSLFE